MSRWMDYVCIEIGLGDKGFRGVKIIILDGLTKTDCFAEYLPTRGMEAGRTKHHRKIPVTAWVRVGADLALLTCGDFQSP
jgi:hypothetical protein